MDPCNLYQSFMLFLTSIPNSFQQSLTGGPLSGFIKVPLSYALMYRASFIFLLNTLGSLPRIFWFWKFILWPSLSRMCLYSPLLDFFVFMSDLWPISRCFSVWPDSTIYLKLQVVHCFKSILFLVWSLGIFCLRWSVLIFQKIARNQGK